MFEIYREQEIFLSTFRLTQITITLSYYEKQILIHITICIWITLLR